VNTFCVVSAFELDMFDAPSVVYPTVFSPVTLRNPDDTIFENRLFVNRFAENMFPVITDVCAIVKDPAALTFVVQTFAVVIEFAEYTFSLENTFDAYKASVTHTFDAVTAFAT